VTRPTNQPMEGLIVPATCGFGGRIWLVSRIWELSKELPVQELPVAPLVEQYWDRNIWFSRGSALTWGNVVDHCGGIMRADLSYPIVLRSDGFLFDGAHRLAKAYLTNQPTIKAVQFEVDPDPDWTD